MNSITFNGKDFELCTRKNSLEKSASILAIENALGHGYRDIFDAYKNPSTRKVKIWLNWDNYFSELCNKYPDIENVQRRITGVNSHVFTICAIITFKNNEHYYMKITPSHNRLYYYHD